MHVSDFHFSDMIVKVISAIVILVVTAFISKFVKKILTKELNKVKVLHRSAGSGDDLAASLGSIASLLIWLFGLMAVLNLFALTSVLSPLQGMLNTFLAALPKVIGAGLIFFVGFVLAKIARELIVTALQAANVDRFSESLAGRANAELGGQGRARKGGQHAAADETGATVAAESSARTSRTKNGSGVQISTLVGQIVFALIVIVVSISALQMLGISAISDPATQMLRMILASVPLILGACILLGIGTVIARFAGNLLESILRGMDIDAGVSKLGVDTSKVDIPALLARIVQIAIVLFFAVAATNMLGFPQITSMLNTVLALGGRVVFGAVIIVAGVFIASIVASMVSGKTATIVRTAIIILFVAMGLKYMGIADSIINLAFAAIVIGGATAAALAFGLGGRNAAARQLEKMQDKSDI